MINAKIENRFNSVLAVVALALVGAVVAAWPAWAFADGVENVRAGQVVDVMPAEATAVQAQANRAQQSYGQPQYGYQQQNYPVASRGYAGTTVGTTVGGALGALLGRHSQTGRVVGGVAGAAIGAAVGNNYDNRSYQAQQQAAYQAQAQQRAMEQAQARYEAQGYQVIVKLDSGQMQAVFVHGTADWYRGQKVWLIGSSRLLPAS